MCRGVITNIVILNLLEIATIATDDWFDCRLAGVKTDDKFVSHLI